MKRKIIIITIILLYFYSGLVKAQTWEYVNTLQNEWLQKICIQGIDTVYIVGQNGLIARSTDRALTWNKQYLVTTQLNDIIFCNHTTGFAVGNNGIILKTTDAGVNWNQVTSGTTNNLNAIAATGLDNIWVVGDNGATVYSKDMGNTWGIKDFGTLSKLNDISFRNGLGYIVGNANICYKTINSGGDWNKEFFNVKNENDNPIESFNLFSIFQTSNNHTFVLYGIDNRLLYLNVDNQFLIDTPDITCYTMANDSIGYGVWASTTTNGNLMIKIQKIMDGNYLEEIRLYPQNYRIDENYSDIAILNDTTGYIVSGNFLYKLTEIVNDVNDVKYRPTISFKQIRQELVINTLSEKIKEIEIYNITGSRSIVMNRLMNNSQSISIGNLTNGVYVIRTVFKDNCISLTKWIKY